MSPSPGRMAPRPVPLGAGGRRGGSPAPPVAAPEPMSDARYAAESAVLREIARCALTFAGPVELRGFMREADRRLALPAQPLEERLSLAADYALASALRAYIEAVKGLAE